MGCISTGAGTTNLEQGGWKRQIRETMFWQRGNEEEGIGITGIFKSSRGGGVEG